MNANGFPYDETLLAPLTDNDRDFGEIVLRPTIFGTDCTGINGFTW